MSTEPLTVSELIEQPFTIHTLNNYTHTRLTSLIDHFGLQSEQVRQIIRVEHNDLVAKLRVAGIDYSDLRNALVPRQGRHEAAFIFDSTRSESGMYGHFFAEKWIPALQWGPETTTLRVGDIVFLPSEFVWGELERHLVAPRDFPRQARELYYVVYMTNLSAQQLRNIDVALTAATEAYLGYVDCSTWNPLKAGMYLPQVGIRLREYIITQMDDVGNSNLPGYPYGESGLQVVGVQGDLYGTYLGHRIDNGVPAWADDDSAVALTALGGDLQPVTSTDIAITQTRIKHLKVNHGASLNRAGLQALDTDDLATAIKAKFSNGFIYNLRFKKGVKNGVSTPELDAMMYSVQVEFPDESSEIKRYQVGLKYIAGTHASEIVTFY